MDQRRDTHYCRWCGRCWPTRTSLQRHYGQAQPCATNRWNHLLGLAHEAHRDLELNLRIPSAALAPRQSSASATHVCDVEGTATVAGAEPIPRTGRSDAQAVDAPRPHTPVAEGMDWAPEEDPATRVEDHAGNVEDGLDNINVHEPVSEGGSERNEAKLLTLVASPKTQVHTSRYYS
jgi:hypothetical protein